MDAISDQQLRSAYERAVQGDLTELRELCGEDFVYCAPGLDLTVRGRDEAIAVIGRILKEMRVRSLQLERIDRYGDFIVSFVSGTSDVRGEIKGVDVARVAADGRAAETYSIRPPLPAGVQLPSGLASGG